MRGKSFRRFQTLTKGMRRLKNDRQHHVPVGTRTLEQTCVCFDPTQKQAFGKLLSNFANNPKRCGGTCCANPRRLEGSSFQEKRNKLRNMESVTP